MIFFYNFLRYALIYPILIILSIFSSKNREFLKKRLKIEKNQCLEKPTIMFHCSSMGETNLAAPLIEKLLKTRSEDILISVFTDTGYENVKNRYNGNSRVKIKYFPLDDLLAVKKIFSEINLKLLFIVETEIWPNLINEASKNGKVIFINGRISDKSFNSYLKIKYFLRSIFSKVDYFFMQSQEDCRRIVELGAKKERVENGGNLKYCIEFEEFSENEKKELKNLINADSREIFVFGSTRENEEEKIVPFLRKNREKRLLVFVPRHLNRVKEVEELLEKNNLTYEKLSEISPKKTDALIVDSMGILRKFYSIADVVFVGGTLVNIGGHSLLEPLFYNKIPIFGPYLQNVKDISEELLKKNIGIKIKTGKEFLEAAEFVMKEREDISEIELLFEKNKNSIKKIIEKINKML